MRRMLVLPAGLACAVVLFAPPAGAELTLVENGVGRVPVVVYENAPPYTRRAADELADYLEKVSGARPPVLEGRPDPLPVSAVWVGFQPALRELFPALDFDFQHPEEILIAASENHLVIAGRDRWDPDRPAVEGGTWLTGGRRGTIIGKQHEYGTVNAVYTFLQDYLGVRWLWPGETGEDVIRRETIAFAPFEYRYYPRFRQRALFYRSMLGVTAGRSHDWTRLQRLQLHSLLMPGGHPFSDWWTRFHEAHPEYFALQPDGTRSGYPSPGNAKLCLSNPAVWEQWLADVEVQVEENPYRTVFAASENDGHSSGICVCANCLAWDHPAGQTWGYNWQGLAQDHVAMTDRYITFWNHLARMLRERYPDRDYRVAVNSYGPGGPPPVAAVLADNTVLSASSPLPLQTGDARQSGREAWLERAKTASNLRSRPNLWWFGGGSWGLPEVAMSKTAEAFRFLADNGCVGMFVDTAWEHWATQGPQYYLMAQLAWNPYLDDRAVLADYYRRGFGPAAGEVEAYWTMLEEATDAFMNHPDYTTRVDAQVSRLLPAVYTPAFLARAGELLRRAEARVAAGPQLYRQRLAFVHAGFEFTRLMIENIPLMARVRASGGTDAEAVRQVADNWAAIERIEQEAGPHAIVYPVIQARMQGGYRGGVADYFGPPKAEFRQAAGLETEPPPPGGARPVPIPNRNGESG